MSPQAQARPDVSEDFVAGAGIRLETLFARQAGRTPDSLALLHRGRKLSYRDLDAAANRLAHHIGTLKLGAETLVGICLDRSPEMVVAILAVLKAGAAYVPLDRSYPRERLEFMLEDSAAPLLIAQNAFAAGLSYRGRVLDLEAETVAIGAQPNLAPDAAGTPADLAYVIYTSGSTGKPKGVMLNHSAAGLIAWAGSSFGAGELARVAATTSICFDPSILELFGPLCNGGAVILKENLLEPFAPDEQPTLLNGVPSAFAELARARSIPDSVRVVNIGGETFKPRLVQDIYNSCRVDRIYNHYGPTEATTCATVALLPRGPLQTLPIGTPIAGALIHVLDSNRRPVPDGAEGELYIAGPTLARGYLNNPALTAERFVSDPFGTAGGRMYRTGDQVRRSATGELEFLGRIDGQLKLHGFRIEPGEIEAALLRLPEVRKAAVMIRNDQYGEARLVAYTESDAALKLSDVRRYLGTWLPEHMLPSLLVVVPAFPLTATGKVDRNALPEPGQKQEVGAAPDVYLPPVEEIIASTFQQVLGSGPVGENDNFFELGGDSLLAVGVILRLEVLLGQPIPPGALFHGSTPKLLAAMLDRRAPGDSNHLTVLQPEGEQLPLFCLPDIFGRPLSYVSLARDLAPEVPVYGLSPGPLEDAIIAAPSVEVLTRAYIREIRKIQPRGPYRISGYSSGGIPAFDLARALEAEGEAVLLILLDSINSRRLPPLRDMAAWAYRHGREAVRRSNVRAVAKQIVQSRHIWLRHPRVVGAKQVPFWVPRNDKQVARSLLQAEKDYRFQPFGGSTVFVHCARRSAVHHFFNFDGMLGWRGLFTGAFTEIYIDSDHYHLMREPVAAQLAERLSRELVVLQNAA